ncbi:hypothetical protein Adt_18382 [Abeliophyllum distichum]|uniref:Uncharacterized protein n=1 Tax=Abeliophyllum distichum TaxID=126358 RepID=A0ABD1TJ87_9LAMI
MPSVAPNQLATALLMVETVEVVLSSLPILSTTPIPVATVSLGAEVVGNVSSHLPTSSMAPDSVATVSLDVEVGDDSPYHPLVVVVEVRPLIFSIKIKGKGVVIGEEERVAPKRDLEEEDVGANSGGVKKSRMASPQCLIFDSTDWVELINTGSL